MSRNMPVEWQIFHGYFYSLYKKTFTYDPGVQIGSKEFVNVKNIVNTTYLETTM